MSRRSESFDQLISEKMKNTDFARETFLTSIEHFGDSVEDALKYTIQQMGLKEFSERSGFSVQHLSDFTKGLRNPKLSTLDKYLAVFELKSKVTVVNLNDAA